MGKCILEIFVSLRIGVPGRAQIGLDGSGYSYVDRLTLLDSQMMMSSSIYEADINRVDAYVQWNTWY